MTMPLKYRKDPVKRREYLNQLCGLPDEQITIKAIFCNGSTCSSSCPNFIHCEKAGVSLGLYFEKCTKEGS